MTDAERERAAVVGTWVKWDGGECPLPPETPVLLEYRGKEDPHREGCRITAAPAARLDWSHDGGADDIIAYQVWTPFDRSEHLKEGR